MNTVLEVSERKIRQQAAKDGVTHFATGVAVFNNSKLLVVRRSAHDTLGGFYELPGGGVDEGETLEQGAIREAWEETGLKVTRVIDVIKGFDYSTSTKPKLRQFNFLVEVEDYEIILSHEHDRYRWITPEQVSDLPATSEMKNCLIEVFSLSTNFVLE
jgi:8-oxo-dGTP diphosphatase